MTYDMRSDGMRNSYAFRRYADNAHYASPYGITEYDVELRVSNEATRSPAPHGRYEIPPYTRTRFFNGSSSVYATPPCSCAVGVRTSGMLGTRRFVSMPTTL